MSKPKPKYYTVWNGRKPGVYKTWDECLEQVKGFKDARYKAYNTLKVAEEAFAAGPPPKTEKSEPSAPPAELFARPNGPIAKSISVDAACSGNPGIMEYRGVDTGTGAEIFRQGPFQQGTNNIGEFLALVHALAFMEQRALTLPVYSDSRTARAWVREKKTKTLLKPGKKNEKIFELIARAEKWLDEHPGPFDIRVWDTQAWGEIPADFGRK